MKLNYRRTILVGFAFLLIMAFWQAYDAIVPLILVNKYGMNQTLSGFIMALDNILALFMLPLFGALSDKTKTKFGKRTPYIVVGTVFAIISFILATVVGNLFLFITMLLIALVSMAIFRSPAVALMPDVTVKPLRSKGNAVINLMGAVGGILVLVLGMLFKTSEEGKTDFTFYVMAVTGIMLVSLIIFILTVKEPKWALEMEEETKKLGDEEVEQREEVGGKLTKGQMGSLILILSSVALWYMGYNAVTSKYSLYAEKVLKQDYNLTLIIAQAAAIVSYFPVGILASKIGRKKSILIGVLVLATAFFFAIFARESTPSFVMYILFALAGIGWATISVNSFPMVVELAKGSDVGKYTGYYYTASMLAQTLTPVFSGAIMDLFGNMLPLFVYATVFVILSFVTMLFVKHGDSKPTPKKSILESLDVDND